MSALYDMLVGPFADYAASPEARFRARSDAEKAFTDLVEFRLYSDIQPGRRITLPNLEQTGLLRMQYKDLVEISEAEDLWERTYAPMPCLAQMSRRRSSELKSYAPSCLEYQFHMSQKRK